MRLPPRLKQVLEPIKPFLSPVLNAKKWMCSKRATRKFIRIANGATQRIVDPNSPVDISLTTYGTRISTVHLTIESIAAGKLLPRRITLWLDDVDAFNDLPERLNHLIQRGLQIKLCRNYGPHTKYYPEILQSQFDAPLVTSDDDILYPQNWLLDLVKAHEKQPGLIHCHRAWRITLIGNTIAPYNTWQPCYSTKPSFLTFATGVSGVIYPPSFLKSLAERGEEFMRLCPKADDVWLHANAVRQNIRISQVSNYPMHFPPIEGSQDVGLVHYNVGNAGNDPQIRETYTAIELQKLMGLYQSRD